MVDYLDFQTVCTITDSWDEIRRIPGFEEAMGRTLFQKFFELEPDAVGLFGYESHDRIECIESTSFNNHAKLVIRMFDKALGMLGPDTEVLVDNLVELGEKHFELGVKPEYYASMGHALTCALKSILGDKYSIDVGEAWVKFFLSMANAMILVQRRIEEKSIDSSQRSDRSSRSRHRHRQQEGSKRINSRN